jgi:hypothetical protein
MTTSCEPPSCLPDFVRFLEIAGRSSSGPARFCVRGAGDTAATLLVCTLCPDCNLLARNLSAALITFGLEALLGVSSAFLPSDLFTLAGVLVAIVAPLSFALESSSTKLNPSSFVFGETTLAADFVTVVFFFSHGANPTSGC